MALGLPGHPPEGVVPRYPPRGVLRDCSRPVPGSCRGVVSPLSGGFPHSPAAVWPPAVRRPAAVGRRGLRVGTAAPPATPAAAMVERLPPAVLDPPAATLFLVGGLGE